MIEKRSILFEDNHLIAVVKKAGDLVQGDKTKDVPLSEKVKEYLKVKYNKQGNVFLGVIHRIDRPVGGVVLFAKTGKALSRMNQLFSNGKCKKIYFAVVEKGTLKKEETLKGFLLKKSKHNKSYVYLKPVSGSKEAVLHYRKIKVFDQYEALEVRLETGRHHQIRAQLAHMGSPIKGDVKYGAKRPNSDASIHLHAWKLAFAHPVSKKPIDLVAFFPDNKGWSAFIIE